MIAAAAAIAVRGCGGGGGAGAVTAAAANFWRFAATQQQQQRARWIATSSNGSSNDSRSYSTNDSSGSSSGTTGTLYEVLGVARAATLTDVKHAFRAKAKELHPDRLHHARVGRRGGGGGGGGRVSAKPSSAAAAAGGSSDGGGPNSAAAFLALVEAYETLSDPERRRLYDASIDSGLPGALRSAAAAAGAAPKQPPGASTAAAHANAPFGWRYGWGDWARDGPRGAARRRPAAGGGGALDGRVYRALERYRDTLESDVHAALLRAFFGPSLEGLRSGELPPSFEAEERSGPAASGDLLHLVSGRDLLGSVRLRGPPAPLLGDGRGGGGSSGGAIGGGGGGGGAARALSWVARLTEGSGGGADPSSRPCFDGRPLTRAQLQQLLGAGADDLAEGCSGDDGDGDGDGTRGDDSACDDDERWADALARAHRLQTPYEWAPPDSTAAELLGDPSASAEAAAVGLIGGSGSGGDGGGGAIVARAQHDEPASNGDGGIGAKALREAWQERMAAIEAAAAGQQQQEEEERQQEQQQQQQFLDSSTDSKRYEDSPSDSSSSSNSNSTEEEEARESRAPPRRRAAPAPEWLACRWGFSADDDDSGGSNGGGIPGTSPPTAPPTTTVVEAAVHAPDGRRLTIGVAARDESQPDRPIKVYGPGGALVAAIVGGRVLAPHSGDLLAFARVEWSPGVSHDAAFFRIGRPPRLLARLRRSWLPPSSAWLFPPRDGAHNVGGWLIEWEGHGAARKPGYLPPAVYICYAAFVSADAERAPPLSQRWRAALARVFPWAFS